MTHYFSENNDKLKSRPQTIKCVVQGKNYAFTTDVGVFSKGGLDFGTRLLLETVLPFAKGNILDLGCGYGPIGIILSGNKEIQVTMTDINRRALELSRENAASNRTDPKIMQSDGFKAIKGNFDLILTNPPVRAGKETIYSWFEDAMGHLSPGGSLIFVQRKDQGAPSSIRFCEDLYPEVAIINKKSGYFVIRCKKDLTI